ncbi:MAG: DUF2243 domain-containing protein [Pigmentiphaga sp.]|uniref:DUF2243 domain-containing protein n=1 Tax=unclassified Pigmentiphaga TaxID=2626614 RepID=UPI000B411DD5|nr:DUF2243 domain-containing protein [Pigmentiphaga sp. NML030171]OVZ64587.1 hypothetical protein CDO46_08355 [Pigmentiphaga sp. NML030171]
MRSVPPACAAWVPSASFRWAGYLLGFALGGFFDGILLHQILQWHHLLSGLQGEAWRDLRVQVMADGLFHLLMYLVALAGLWLLWRARTEAGRPGAGRLSWALVLVGFGAWHVLDAVLSHWLLGIHRIRMDAAHPLWWDLAWFAVFGLGSVAAGAWLRRRGGKGRGGQAGILALLAAVAIALPWSLRPPPGMDTVVVLFRPGTSAPQALAALERVDAKLLWGDASGQLWAVRPGPRYRAMALYRHGALWVAGAMLPMGCLGWFKA